jgi:hypothetical protein
MKIEKMQDGNGIKFDFPFLTAKLRCPTTTKQEYSMGIFTWLSNTIFSSTSESVDTSTSLPNSSSVDINPASGLPMIGDAGGVDVAGNIYGSKDTTLICENNFFQVDSPPIDFSNDFSCSFDSDCSFDIGTSMFD